MLKELSPGGRWLPSRMKLLITGGESVTGRAIRKLREGGGERMRILHVYGPSETTITATQWEVGAVEGTGRVAIGRPLWNVQVYVLDQDERVSGGRRDGQVVIGGAEVARGMRRCAADGGAFCAGPPWSGVAGE